MAAPDLNDDAERVRQLTLKKCSGSLSEEGVAELSDLLATSKQARELYWELVTVHAQLEWELGAKTMGDESPANQVPSVVTPASQIRMGRKAVRVTAWLLGIAACLLFAVLNIPWDRWRGGSAHERTVAQAPDEPSELSLVFGTLTSLVPQSRWSFGRVGDRNHQYFRQGDTLWLEEGALELRLTSGAVAALQSPLIMQASSLNHIRLIRGEVKIDVSDEAEGLIVETSSAEVIDIGTVYSVNVESGNTNVVVFDGEVDLKVAEQPGHANKDPQTLVKRVSAGEAVQVADDGTLSRIVTVRQQAFDAKSVRSVITAVNDNIVRDDFYSFYEIVPGGMREDAQAFVDRPHQWNGIRGGVMPSYLVDGDYVKTFNDDKVADNVQMDVTLDRPATLYVMLDDRVTPPDWLTNSFEDTGDDIGVDEVPISENKTWSITDQNLQVGPGRSIDRIHSIWKRVMPESGVVSLGANGRLEDASDRRTANMYGLVAVALADE